MPHEPNLQANKTAIRSFKNLRLTSKRVLIEEITQEKQLRI